jgi:predicted transposase YbfD/YdcC
MTRSSALRGPAPAGDRDRQQGSARREEQAGKAPHLVAALAHGIGTVLGQVAVDAKSNEISAVRDLLRAFQDLTWAVITTGAMHTQHDTAQVILGRGADYSMSVKPNMPTLYQQLKKLPWASVPVVSSVSTGHGRRDRRTVKAVLAPAWIGFDGAAQVAQLRRTVTKKERRLSRSSTSSPATPVPALPPWPPGPGPAGTSRTSSTGFATSPDRRTSHWSGWETHHA